MAGKDITTFNGGYIEWDNDGFKELLQAPELASLVHASGEQIANKAGDGFKSKPWTSTSNGRYGRTTRPAAIVSADTYAARRAEATNKTLTKATTSCGTK